MTSRGQVRPTLRDVATRAGVSVSTASLVFSGKGPVAESTADKVRAAAADLGFTGPNPLASSLRHGRAGVVAVIVEGRVRHALRDPFAISVLDGLAEALDAIPSGLLLMGQPGGEADAPDAIVTQLAGLALDAVVFSLCGPAGHPAMDQLAARGIPMFGTGVPDDPRVTHVRIDERAAGAEMSRHVKALGHRRVATVTMPLTGLAAQGRLDGFRDVFGRKPVAVETSDGSSVEGGLAAGRALLDVGCAGRPTAIVAQSDVIAAGVIRAAEDLGLRVPENLSVTGFDGVDLPWLAHRLTTMDQAGQDKGRLLGTLVRLTLEGGRPRGILQEVTLREGTTTARPG